MQTPFAVLQGACALADIDDLDSARWFASLARDLAEQPDHDSTLRRITELAVGATGCSGVGIVHLTSRGLSYDYASDPELVVRALRVSAETRQGVAWTALHTRSTVRVDDLSTDPRWPAYSERMTAQTPIRSALAYCLVFDDVVLGAMALYSMQPGYFTDAIDRFAAVFADHAAIALSRAQDHDKIDNLELALTTNRTIGAAMGIVMSALDVKMDSAFDLLRLTSQNANRKLHDICDEIVRAGDITPINDIARQTAERRARASSRLELSAVDSPLAASEGEATA